MVSVKNVDNMVSKRAFDTFIIDIEHTLKHRAIGRDDFLRVARLAIDAYREDPRKREVIACKMTGLWVLMKKKHNRLDPDIDEIGEYFGGLELPDEHVDKQGYASVDDAWGGVAQMIKQASGNE